METIILSFGIILILGVLTRKILNKLKIPAFLGFLATGILLGPYVSNILDPSFRDLTQEICRIAIIILLIRVGLSVRRDDIYKVGKPAVEMSFLPSIIEGCSIIFIGHYLLGISFIEAGMLGFILSAVSPAILVPRMLELIDKWLGVGKCIPTILLFGSAADGVVSITIFSVFLGIYTGGHTDITWDLIGIPVSLIFGVLLGFLTGLILIFVFRKWDFSDAEKLFITLATAIILNAIGEITQGKIPIAGLVGVMVIGLLILNRSPKIALSLSNSYSTLWILAEIIVFVLLGAQLNLSLILSPINIGTIILPIILVSILVISLGLLFRFVGVYLALLKTDLNNKEKLFCMISYIPKATVQATIGGVPLAVGVLHGDLILAVSAISIIYTAPLGAILIKFFRENGIIIYGLIYHYCLIISDLIFMF
ncbi:MAG: cation:proton antiporter [Methanobrevibacter sp.]|nr:cation:proton antiporter [Methanobrevibacter sp.]